MIYVIYTYLTNGYPDTHIIRRSKGAATTLLRRGFKYYPEILDKSKCLVRCIDVNRPAEYKDISAEDWLAKKGDYKNV
jgi:hypothetical protein